MAPLVVLAAVTALVAVLGWVAVPSWRSWPVALRSGVAAMFVLTGTSHFIGMRSALIDMVPSALPAPELLVTITGVLELAGAVGLFIAPLRRWAAGGLSVMLIAMFPANVHKALSGTDLAWNETLLPRTIMQVLFLAATVTILIWDVRGRRGTTRRGIRTQAARTDVKEA